MLSEKIRHTFIYSFKTEKALFFSSNILKTPILSSFRNISLIISAAELLLSEE